MRFFYFIFYVPHSSSEAPEAVKAGFTLQGSSDPLPHFISSCVAPIGIVTKTWKQE